ncbi:MAG TPA: adenylate/guanylate cyclase domain-containing protein, partial [Methylomirabilota bacterium]|nr:adenylate/guanylate cyclase domain-containing protein [Methylomirabilota bacterium]
MARCPTCQHENAPQAKFCGECGARLEQACRQCGHKNPAGSKFCSECGQSLAPVEAGAQGLRDAAPASYTPKHLAEKILTLRSALEGERKMVTVLFCDLQGSTPLAERIGPEGMHDLLNRLFELALAAVHRYEGSVNQFLGDGFMALFGAPIAHEDHASRAAFAALEIRESLGTLNVELAARGTPLHIRIGINTGPVVVGGIGDNLRMDYTAIGDTTNLASRLQTLADPDSILVSESTHELIRPYLQCTPLGAREVKGKAHPVPVFRVDGARERRTRFDLSLERGLTGLVGRQWEMGLLQSRWAEALAGRGQAVVLIGEAGVGKSRLLYEFRQSLSDQAVAFEGRCLPYERGVSYAPVVEILRRLFGIGDQERPEDAREKIKAGVERLGPELKETLPFLLNLFSHRSESEAL